MKKFTKDILSYFGIEVNTPSIEHYGRSKKDGAPGPGSGRYPLGSGDDPNQHRGDFVSRVKALRKQGMSDIDICKAVGVKSTTELRKQYTVALNDQKAQMAKQALALLADGKSQADVTRILDIPESTLRGWIKEKDAHKTVSARETADFLRKQVEEKGMIDVGAGVEYELNITATKMNAALKILENEGYPIYKGGVQQATNPNQQTHLRVLCTPGHQSKDIYQYDQIKSITDYKCRPDENGKDTFEKGFKYPESMDSKRLMIRYKDDVGPDGHAGIEKDGVIEIRRGVKDLNLGDCHYAQVRILVDNDRYLKGMAVYSDDMPKGVDVIFNTNKDKSLSMRDVLKPIGSDPDNPFGALLREKGGQYEYTGDDGKQHLGLINKTRMEGDWGEWSDRLPSQFLSKQPKKLIERQLGLSLRDKEEEFRDIMSLTNPTVKKSLLWDFANDCDSTAEHLDAASLPRQKYQVILPLTTISDHEVYAPGYRDGETVALIRYPHGGTFEIPILKVNNKNPDGRRIFGDNPKDMIGVNKAVADRLSGADFDGDTAMVIPCNNPGSSVRILSTHELSGLKNFDAKVEYGYSRKEVDANGVTHYYRNGHEYKPLSKEYTQKQMGIVSNLITDMTLKGATELELARAVRHSMVVIDAAKHKLDWKASEVDNQIGALKEYYQKHTKLDGKIGYGAATLISRAKGEESIPKTQGSPRINEKGKSWYDPTKPEGSLVYKLADDLYWYDKKGKEHMRTQASTQMAQVTDANRLSSGTIQERLYADYANTLKKMANQARKEYLVAGKIKYDPRANLAYKDEVNRLLSQLSLAKVNAPKERMVQLAVRSSIDAMKKADPDMTKKDEKKRSQQLLTKFRILYGAKRNPIEITERGWLAIQSGAITETKLRDILKFADKDIVRQYATPRTFNTISPAKQARIAAMRASGYTTQEIADAVGVSKSTVQKYM